ncbi:MAG TPA: hypothetical protein PKA64_25215, partial [Myxococcota bacterium]|nr:hypothetical protein [Myxococcota bacterium]
MSERRSPSDGSFGTALVLVLVALVLLLRDRWEPRVAPGRLVEVRGAVARPGLYRVDPPTLRA